MLAQDGNDYIGFSASFDPCGVASGKDPAAKPDQIRSFLRFTGHNADGRRSLLHTAYGLSGPNYALIGEMDAAILAFHEIPDEGRNDPI
ncbi:hypothetical protein ACFCP7_26995 [Paenibacillus elgii]